jgi:hypothetical protein
VVLSGLAPHSAPASRSDVRVWPAPGLTPITIESNQAIEYTVFTAKGPDRSSSTRGRNVTRARGPPIRIGADDPYTPRHVWRAIVPAWCASCSNCAEKSSHRRSLQPVGGYAHRLVVTSILPTRWTRFPPRSKSTKTNQWALSRQLPCWKRSDVSGLRLALARRLRVARSSVNLTLSSTRPPEKVGGVARKPSSKLAVFAQ